MAKLALALLAVAALAVSASAANVNFTYTFSKGLSFCSQCGTPGQYACSPDSTGATVGDWNNGIISFYDPTPVGAVPRTFRIALYGAWSCDPTTSSSMFAASLNGITLAVRDTPFGQTSSPCKCDTCDQSEALQFSFRNGVPSYIKGGQNRLQLLTYRNNICINRAVVIIDYETTNTELPHAFVPVKDFRSLNSSTTCPTCNNGQVGESLWCSSSSSTALTFSVNDPLPTGALLVGVDIHFSYNMISKSYLSYYTTLNWSLLGTAIGTERCIDTSFRQQCGCMANAVTLSPFYQRGWPNYVYKARNTFSVGAVRYAIGYGDVCIGRLGIDFIYYIPGETDAKVMTRYIEPNE